MIENDCCLKRKVQLPGIYEYYIKGSCRNQKQFLKMEKKQLKVAEKATKKPNSEFC